MPSAIPRAISAELFLAKVALGTLLVILVFGLHLPDEQFIDKWNLVGASLFGIFLFSLTNVLNARHWGSLLALSGILAVWILYIYLHSRSHPPGTEYAINKFPFFVLITFTALILIPAAFSALNAWKHLVLALFAVGFIFAALSFFPAVAGTNIRFSVIGLNPVLMAKLASLPIIVALTASPSSPIWRAAYWGAAMIAVAASINTGSRTPLFAIAVAHLIAMLRRTKARELFRSAGVYILLGGIFFLYLSIADPELAERFSLEMLSRQGEMRQGDRLFLHNLAIDVSRENPWGIGFGNFSTVFWIAAPHNIFLEALVELGIPGVMPLLLLTLMGLQASMRLLKDDDPIGRFLGTLFIYNLITSLVGNELTLPSLLFYISLSCSVTYQRFRAAAGAATPYPRTAATGLANHRASGAVPAL